MKSRKASLYLEHAMVFKPCFYQYVTVWGIMVAFLGSQIGTQSPELGQFYQKRYAYVYIIDIKVFSIQLTLRDCLNITWSEIFNFSGSTLTLHGPTVGEGGNCAGKCGKCFMLSDQEKVCFSKTESLLYTFQNLSYHAVRGRNRNAVTAPIPPQGGYL